MNISEINDTSLEYLGCIQYKIYQSQLDGLHCTLNIPEEVLDIGLLLLVRALLGVELEAPVLAVAHLDPVSGARHCLSHGQRLATQALILICYPD